MKRIKQKVSQILTFSKSSQLAGILFGEIIVGVLLILLSLFIFFKLGDEILEKDTIFFDNSITQFVYLFRNPLLTEVMKGFTFLGGELFIGTGIILTVFLLLRKHKKDALIFAFILFFGVGLNILLKDMFHRPRPTLLPLVHETSFSFPSGHAMNSFVFYTCLSFFIFRKLQHKRLKILLITVSGILIFLIGLSRIYLGAHFPSDVIAGYTAGLCWFVLVLLFEKTLLFFHLFRQYEVDKKY